jgi:hypothetical protein
MQVIGQLHSASCLNPGEGAEWIGGWAGPRLDAVKKKKNPFLAENRSPGVQHVSYRYTDSSNTSLYPFQVLDFLL